MKRMTLKFAAFKGMSLMSTRIRLFTRGMYSHVASFIDQEALSYLEWIRKTPMQRVTLIEQWPHGSNPVRAWMDYSDMSRHTPGTVYEIWGLDIPVTDVLFRGLHPTNQADPGSVPAGSGCGASVLFYQFN